MAFQRPFLISLRRDDSSEPWGFRLDGGGVTSRPVTVQQVLERSLAEKVGLHEGDQVIQVGRINVQGRSLSEVQELILTCRNRVELFIIREDLLRDRRENEPLTVKAIVHSPYNSPKQLYSQDNVAETLATQALILCDPDVQPNHLGPKSPPTVIHSNVLDALREQGEKGPRLNGEIVTTPPRKKKQPPPVLPKPQPPNISQSPPAKASVYPGNMEQLQYQNYSTYHREEKRTSQRTSGYGDYEDVDTDLSMMYPQPKTFKSQTSFTPQQADTMRAQPQQTVRSQQTFQQESRLRDYQTQREEEIRRAELVRQQELQQQEAFEIQQRQLREQQQRQSDEQRQRQINEQQQRQINEQQQRQINEQQQRQIHEQQLREQRAHEQQTLEQQKAREQQQLREQRAREQQAIEQQRAREQRAKEQQAREQQERLAAQQRQRYEHQQQSRETQSRQQSSQAQLQARQYEQQRLVEQRKAQEAYEQQRQAQMRAQQQPQYYAQPQQSHHDMEYQKKLTSTSRVVPANLGSPTTQRRGGCSPSWPPKNSSVRELPRTGFSPTFVQERGSKEFVWPPPKPDELDVKDSIPHVQGHAGEAWHPQSDTHVSRPHVPRSPTPTRRCGDAMWPPAHVLVAEASAYNRQAPGSPQPVCRRGKFEDYVTHNNISNVPPTYRVPPGTVHVNSVY